MTMIALLLLLLSDLLAISNAQDEITSVLCSDSDVPLCSGRSINECDDNTECIITCQGEEVCKDATFQCPLNNDCTLICDSEYGTKPCMGVTLNAANSNNININILCNYAQSCEFITVNASSSINTNINFTAFTKPNSLNQHRSAHTAKNAEIYLPKSGGNTYINCYGHSVCGAMKIYGNDSSDIDIEFIAHGLHSFREGLMILPSDSSVSIECYEYFDDDKQYNNDPKGGSCVESMFDGTVNGQNSNLEINCLGNYSCAGITILSHKLSKSLNVNGGNGNNVLSESVIYCPSLNVDETIQSVVTNCNIRVNGDGLAMLNNTIIYAQKAFDDVLLICDYVTSITANCYNNELSAPELYCGDVEDGTNDSCSLQLTNNKINEWSCFDGDVISCIDNLDDLNDDLQQLFGDDDDDEMVIETTEEIELIFSTTQTIRIFNHNNDQETIGLFKNRKGQIVLSSIIMILVALSIAVCVAKRDSIRDWIKNERTLQLSGGSRHTNNSSDGGNMKARYSSLDEANRNGDDEDEDDDIAEINPNPNIHVINDVDELGSNEED